MKIDEFKKGYESYEEYLTISETKLDEIAASEDLIIKDIHRTFSKHPSLSEEYSETQH